MTRAESEAITEGSRSLADTLPGDSVRSAAILADFPSWCVDLGHTLVAMSTSQLSATLNEGTLAPQTKVWREGMMCWEPVANVPELALARSSVPRSFGRSPASTSLPEATVSAEENTAMLDSELLEEWPELFALDELVIVTVPCFSPAVETPALILKERSS